MIKFAVFAPEMTWKHVRNTVIVLSERYHNSKVSILEVKPSGYTWLQWDFHWFSMGFQEFSRSIFGGLGWAWFSDPKIEISANRPHFWTFQDEYLRFKKNPKQKYYLGTILEPVKKIEKIFLSILGTATQGTFNVIAYNSIMTIDYSRGGYWIFMFFVPGDLDGEPFIN